LSAGAARRHAEQCQIERFALQSVTSPAESNKGLNKGVRNPDILTPFSTVFPADRYGSFAVLLDRAAFGGRCSSGYWIIADMLRRWKSLQDLKIYIMRAAC
jgi:hypothetical protein